MEWNENSFPLERPADSRDFFWSSLQSETNNDKSSWHTCLRLVLLSTISFIYYFIPFKRRKPLHPQISVVWSKRKTWGSKIQHWFCRGKGLGYIRGGDRYVHYAKRGHFTEVSPRLYPSVYWSLLRRRTFERNSSLGYHTLSEMDPGKQHTFVDLKCRRKQKLYSVKENERVDTMRVEEISESPEAT